MAVTQRSKIIVDVDAELTDPLDLGGPIDKIVKKFAIELAHGNGAGAASMIYRSTRTLGASATENLDLAGVLLSPFGAVITFLKIKAIIVVARAANTNNVEVVREVTNGVPIFLALGDGVSIHPGGMFCLVAPSAAGYGVTATTGDLIKVTNSGGGSSVTYDIIIMGAV